MQNTQERRFWAKGTAYTKAPRDGKDGIFQNRENVPEWSREGRRTEVRVEKPDVAVPWQRGALHRPTCGFLREPVSIPN